MKKLIMKLTNLPVSMKASFAFIIANFLQKGISLITIPIFTRILTEENYGQISVYNSWREIINIIISFSLAGGVINNAMLDFKEEKDEFLSSIFSLIIFSTIIFFILYKITEIFWGKILNFNNSLINFMFLGFAFNSSFGIWSIKEKFDYKYKKIIIISFCICIFSPILSYYLLKNSSLEQVSAKIYGDGIVILLINIIIFAIIFIKGKTIVNFRYWKYALKFNIPLIPHYLSNIILLQSDRIMIARYINLEKAGIYNLAYIVASVIGLIITAINSSFVPYSYKQMEKKNYKEIGQDAEVLSEICALGTLIFILLGPEFIKIMAPPSYYEAIYTIPPVVLGNYYIFIYTFFGNIEFYHKKTKFIMFATVLASLTNIILNIIFIQKYGYLAAGYTTMISYFFMIILHYYFMRKIEKNKIYNIKKIFIIVIMTTILGLTCLIFYKYILIRFIFLLILCFIGIFKIIKIYKKFDNELSNKI